MLGEMGVFWENNQNVTIPIIKFTIALYFVKNIELQEKYQDAVQNKYNSCKIEPIIIIISHIVIIKLYHIPWTLQTSEIIILY